MFFGRWSIGIPEHVATRKTQRRTHEGGRRAACSGCGFGESTPQDTFDDSFTGASFNDSVPSTRDLYSSPFHQACTVVRLNFV